MCYHMQVVARSYHELLLQNNLLVVGRGAAEPNIDVLPYLFMNFFIFPNLLVRPLFEFLISLCLKFDEGGSLPHFVFTLRLGHKVVPIMKSCLKFNCSTRSPRKLLRQGSNSGISVA